jgi:hypothetical protein
MVRFFIFIINLGKIGLLPLNQMSLNDFCLLLRRLAPRKADLLQGIPEVLTNPSMTSSLNIGCYHISDYVNKGRFYLFKLYSFYFSSIV